MSLKPNGNAKESDCSTSGKPSVARKAQRLQRTAGEAPVGCRPSQDCDGCKSAVGEGQGSRKKALEVHKKLGKRIAALRKKRGFTQEAFAHECDFNRSYMGAVERGEKNITLAMVNKSQWL